MNSGLQPSSKIKDKSYYQQKTGFFIWMKTKPTEIEIQLLYDTLNEMKRNFMKIAMIDIHKFSFMAGDVTFFPEQWKTRAVHKRKSILNENWFIWTNFVILLRDIVTKMIDPKFDLPFISLVKILMNIWKMLELSHVRIISMKICHSSIIISSAMKFNLAWFEPNEIRLLEGICHEIGCSNRR